MCRCFKALVVSSAGLFYGQIHPGTCKWPGEDWKTEGSDCLAGKKY